jgi:hypothetical protein
VWNEIGISRKLEILQTEFMKKKIDIAILSETKTKLKGSKERTLYPNLQWSSPREKSCDWYSHNDKQETGE